jgi:transposase
VDSDGKLFRFFVLFFMTKIFWHNSRKYSSLVHLGDASQHGKKGVLRMSLHPQPHTHIPERTAELMHRVYPKGHPFIALREELGTLFTDDQFVHLYDPQGRPVESPTILALASVLQFLEGLTDRQTAEAVRDRLTWKYLLGLELDATGFDSTLLSDFRKRLVEEDAIMLLFETMLSAFQARGLLKSKSKQRTDSTHVLAAVRNLERVELVGETMRDVLEHLAIVAPNWVRMHVPADWVDRYADRFDSIRLPKDQSKRVQLAETIGQDGQLLLAALDAADAPAYLRELPAVQTLRTVWDQQYAVSPQGTLRWRESKALPPAGEQVVSPFDTEARFSKKRETEWVGYKVHLTETCDEETPSFITDVQTTDATTPDSSVTGKIQADLVAHDLMPSDQYVDAGYPTAEHLVTSAEQGIALIGPVNEDTSWQSRVEDGYTMQRFTLDWEQEQATCPEGKTSVAWHSDDGKVRIEFDQETCAACPARAKCTRATTSGRVLKVLPQEQHAALQTRRAEQQTKAFRTKYQQRAGIEGTISQGTRGFDLRYARYWGLAKTTLQHVLVAVAINLYRLMVWLMQPFQGTAGRRTRRGSYLAETMQAPVTPA